MRGFTDYPIVDLGDKPYVQAPIRECLVLSYDGDKYCEILVGENIYSIKAGYIYTQVTQAELGELPLTEDD